MIVVDVADVPFLFVCFWLTNATYDAVVWTHVCCACCSIGGDDAMTVVHVDALCDTDIAVGGLSDEGEFYLIWSRR